MNTPATETPQTLEMLLRALKLPSFALHHEDEAKKAESEGWAFTRYLRHLVELELGDRRHRRVEPGPSFW